MAMKCPVGVIGCFLISSYLFFRSLAFYHWDNVCSQVHLSHRSQWMTTKSNSFEKLVIQLLSLYSVDYCYLRGFGLDITGWAKSQFTYVGLNSSVTECSIEIILSGMTYYNHWFEEFVKSKHICVHFFQMKVHFRIYLIVWIVGSSQILLDCVWPFELRFY